MRVLVWKEAGVLVAQAIEQDMATQGAVGCEDPLVLIEDLGIMFDARDRFMVEHYEERVEPLPEAPIEYRDAWEAGSPLKGLSGPVPLGLKRTADVRLGCPDANPTAVWKANRDAGKPET